MDEDGTTPVPAWRFWLKRVGIALGLVVLLLIVFHRPLLQTVARRAAIHFAAKQNLKVDLRVEGSVLGGITLRNVRVVATGPAALESADVDLVRVDYSLWGYFRGGLADLLQEIEVKNASIVLDPEKAPPDEKVVQEKKITLPALFPDRLMLADVNVRVKSKPQDLLLEHLYLDLNPTTAGELRIARLQLTNGRTWQTVTAQTSYANHNLFLRNFILDDQTHLDVVNLDASKIGSGQVDVAVQGTFAGAKLDGKFSLGEEKQTLGTKINFAVEDTSLAAVTEYFEPPKLEDGRIKAPELDANHPEPSKLSGTVERLAVVGEGRLDAPNSWNGTIRGEIKDLSAGGVVFDTVSLDVEAAAGRAVVKNLVLTRGANTIKVEGAADLPARTEEFGRVPATFNIRADVPELGSLTAGMAQPITGPAELNGQIAVREATIHIDLAAVAGPVNFGTGTVERAVVKLQAAKKMPAPMPDEEDVGGETVPPPYYSNLTSQIGLEISALKLGDYAVDSITAKVETAEKSVTLEQLLAVRGENRLTAQARYELPLDFGAALSQPGRVEGHLVAPEVGDFWVAGVEKPVTGAVDLSFQTELGPKLGGGSFNLSGTNLSAQKLTVPQISAQGTIADNVVYLNDLTAQLNQSDFIRASGQAALDGPHVYSGKLEMKVANLETFEPVLRALKNESELAGALAINWEGQGAVTGFKNTGDLKLKLENGRYGDLKKLEATVDANYTPQELNVPIIYFSSDQLMVQAIMQAKDGTLEVTRLQIDQGKAKYAAGYIAVPFVWENLGTEKPLFPSDGKVLINFQTENLDIEKLAKDLGTTAPVSGLANVKLEATGTLDDLQATFELQLTGLRSAEWSDFAPAVFNIGGRLENKKLLVEGKFEQNRIEPVQINASLPLDLAKILQAKEFDEQTPIQASVKMPRSSVNFIRQFVPALERIDGNLALDVNVAGTIANPSLNGSADMTINAARFSNPTLPTVTNFNARLAFTQARLDFEQFRGELAGGPFALTGRITFEKLTEPVFDLQLKADAVLVARNDDMTVRTDANISIKGPLASAAVEGEVALTNSQFLKNLDLIPIGVPGRPAPAPAPPSATSELSFPEPPFRDWTFNLTVKTKDAFKIRGNLAQGGALVDMRITGTGLKPLVDGSVRLENVDVTLPFSRLEINQGFIYFNPQDPLNPGLDLQGTSLIRDYTVRVYVYGTADAPEAVFTSEPPLPQEEIISLLATGVTREQLASGGNVLAGRALMLLGQQLYQKVFKKGKSDNTNSIFDKLQVDVGGVDPRTGQQTAVARYRATDQVQLIGEIGVQGDFRGTVKYLIRFR